MQRLSLSLQPARIVVVGRVGRVFVVDLAVVVVAAVVVAVATVIALQYPQLSGQFTFITNS